MKKLFFSAAFPFLLASCTVTTAPKNADYTENTTYAGYTVGYGSNFGNAGSGDYRGYGGWTSTYYSPGYRYSYWRM